VQEEELFFRKKKLFQKEIISTIACAIVLSLISPRAYASQTVLEKQFNITNVPAINNPEKSTTDTDTSLSTNNSTLATLADDFIKPAMSLQPTTNSTHNNTHSLPAAPAAFIMSLFGFICISAIKDRKLWLAALSALLCASQAGFNMLPHLAVKLGHKIYNTQKLIAKSVRYPPQRRFYRSRTQLESTEFIFLLHHLNGIPNFLKNKTNTLINSYNVLDSFSKAVIKTSSSKNEIHKDPSEKIISQCDFVKKTIVFQAIPRGPPLRK
jgi:hypothetical protein